MSVSVLETTIPRFSISVMEYPALVPFRSANSIHHFKRPACVERFARARENTAIYIRNVWRVQGSSLETYSGLQFQ